MPRHFCASLLLSLAALCGCVPAEYREASDILIDADTPAPKIIPLHSLVLPDDIADPADADAQTSLDSRNESLAQRAATVAGQSTNLEDDAPADARAIALRDRAQIIRSRE